MSTVHGPQSTVPDKKIKQLVAFYHKQKHEIKERLKEFKNKDKDLFKELCFCLLTPQSKAISCDKAIKELSKKNLLSKGRASQIAATLKKFTRFHNKKACFLVGARRVFCKGKLNFSDSLNTREWLVQSIKGLGYKEASHFLRNIGHGSDISILDRHILENLRNLGIIGQIPQSLTRKRYLDIEDKMRILARRVNIPLEELDLLFWSSQTGFIFK